MTTILLTIVGILLAAVAVLMVLWYGGEAMDKGAMKAQANTTLNNVQQVANAIVMHNVHTGLPLQAGDDAANVQLMVDEGFLSAIPGNPVRETAGTYRIVDMPGNNMETARWVIMDIGNDDHAKGVCRVAERSFSRSESTPQVEAQVKFGEWAPLHRRPSCINNYWSNSFLLYVPI